MAFCGNFVKIFDCRAFNLFETVPGCRAYSHSEHQKEKDLRDHDNYFWRETNRNSNLIVHNVGCRKREEVRKGQKL